MAALAQQRYSHSRGQQRGLLVSALAGRMGLDDLKSSRKGRQAKRPRTAQEPGPAGGGAGEGRYYPGGGHGNETTFHPPRTQAAAAAGPYTLAVRRCTYLDLPGSQRQRYDELAGCMKELGRGDPGRQQLKQESRQLPGTLVVRASRQAVPDCRYGEARGVALHPAECVLLCRLQSPAHHSV